MTALAATLIAESVRWTVVGAFESRGVTTLHLRTPLGRAFSLHVYPHWTEEQVVEKLRVMQECPV